MQSAESTQNLPKTHSSTNRAIRHGQYSSRRAFDRIKYKGTRYGTLGALALWGCFGLSGASSQTPANPAANQGALSHSMTGGSGSMALTTSCYTRDLGHASSAVGFVNQTPFLIPALDLIIINKFEAPVGGDVISEISATFGSPDYPGQFTPGPFFNIDWVIWDDPNNDHQPGDATLLWTDNSYVDSASIDTDVFQTQAVPDIPVSGVFFIGIRFSSIAVAHPGLQIPGTNPASRDNNAGQASNSWAGQADPFQSNLGDLSSLSALHPSSLGVWLLRAKGQGCLPASCYEHDQGGSEWGIGFLDIDFSMIALAGYHTQSDSDIITELSSTFGSPGSSNFYAPGAITWGIWNDPNNDFDPSDAVLLWSLPDVVSPASVDSDVFQSISVPGVSVQGVYFIGVAIENCVDGEFPAAQDLDAPSGGHAWIAGNFTAPQNMAHLSWNEYPPREMASVNLDGSWLIRAKSVDCPTSGTGYCYGDGTALICPCFNFGGRGEGCGNSSGLGGAKLKGSGGASLSDDTFELLISGVPGSQLGLLLRGANRTNGGFGNLVGDGLLCVGGSLARSQVQMTSLGNTTFTHFNGNPFGQDSFGAGVSTHYQFWYRDGGNNCSGSGFNFSNAWSVIWMP